MSWVLPYLDEWHLLKNANIPLFKIFLDGGLRNLLKLYHHGATERSVENATNFDKAHSFLMQSWEALYRHQIARYFQVSAQSLASLFPSTSPATSDDFLQLMSTQLQEVSSVIDQVTSSFMDFCSDRSAKDGTFSYWNGFAHNDMFYYYHKGYRVILLF